MLLTVRAVLEDGRVVDFAREVGDEERLSAAQLLERQAQDGYLALSDSEKVPLGRVVSVEFVAGDAPAGPGWGPGLQDEDAASAAGSNYDGPKRG